VKYFTRCFEGVRIKVISCHFFSDIRIFKALWACLKRIERGLCIISEISPLWNVSFILFEKCDTIVTNSKTTTDMPLLTYKQMIPVYSIFFFRCYNVLSAF
jgi:hypothetical protein